MTLQAHVDRYVALKRHLGYKFVNNERILRSWAAWAMTCGDSVRAKPSSRRSSAVMRCGSSR